MRNMEDPKHSGPEQMSGPNQHNCTFIEGHYSMSDSVYKQDVPAANGDAVPQNSGANQTDSKETMENTGKVENGHLSATTTTGIGKEPYEPDENAHCGVGNCRPSFLQPCSSLLSFVVVQAISVMFQGTLLAFLPSQVTSIERQFGISSTVSGFILSCNDIGFLATVLFTAHFGRRMHIPRVLSCMGLLYGVAGLMPCLAQLLHPASLPASGGHGGEEAKTVDVRSLGLYLLGTSYLLQGVAKTVRNPLTAHYVDNNIKDRTNTGFYIGWSLAAQVLSTPIAQGLGGVFSKIPVDLSDTQISTKDPRWIGAWWLGFLTFGIASLIVSVPMFCYPRRYKKKTPANNNDGPNAQQQKQKRTRKTLQVVKDLPVSIFRILKDPVVFFALLGMVLYTFAISGFINFSVKYFERQFNLPSWEAAITLSIANVLSTVAGTLIGSYVTRRWRLTRIGCTKFSVFVTGLSCVAGAFMFYFGCDNQPIYGLGETVSPTSFKVDSTMAELPCGCDRDDILLACGADGRSYLSPCFAGCTNATNTGFAGCTEVLNATQTVTPGLCDTGCGFKWHYVIAGWLAGITGTMAVTPKYLVLIRSVNDRDKSMVIAIFNFLSSLLAWLPAPVVYGKVIDGTCMAWNKNGACALYDIEAQRYHLIGVETAFKVTGSLLFVLVYIALRRSKDPAAKLI